MKAPYKVQSLSWVLGELTLARIFILSSALPWPPALPNLCQFLKGIESDFSEPLQAAFELFKFSSSCLSWLLFLILQNSSYRFLLHKTSPSAGDLVAPYVLLWH